MSRTPPSLLKRLLLPAWNGGHRLAWRVGEHLDAIRSRRFETCSVCGRFGPTLLRRWVIPPRLVELWELSPRLASALARKESLDCGWCGAKLRARRLARALLESEGEAGTEPPAASVAAWVTTPRARSLRVAEINLVDGLHRQLARLPGHRSSDYLEGARPGETVGGVRHEDLQSLTYEDEAFDLVVTSETLEHVPNLERALAEIHRVLVPGGRHVFTIPLLPGVDRTLPRTTLDENGTPIHLMTPIHHPGGDVGYPVFTEFGADLIGILERAGFEAEMKFGPPTEDDLGQVFVTRKRD